MVFGKTCGQLWQISQLIVAHVKGFQESEVAQTALQAANIIVLQPGSNPHTATAAASMRQLQMPSHTYSIQQQML